MLGWLGSVGADLAVSLLTVLGSPTLAESAGMLTLSIAGFATFVLAVIGHHATRHCHPLVVQRMGQGTARRRRAMSAIYVPLSDPNAPGRSQPRAPGC